MKPKGIYKFSVTVNLDEGRLGFRDESNPGKSAMSFVLFDPANESQLSDRIGNQIVARVNHLQESEVEK